MQLQIATEVEEKDGGTLKDAVDELYTVLKDRKSHRDIFRYSAGTLAARCQSDKEFLGILAKNEKVIENLAAPICDKLYDAHIVKSVLSVIALLIPIVEKPKDLKSNLEDLKNLWNLGVDRKVSEVMSMRIPRSQQCVKECEKCLGLLG